MVWTTVIITFNMWMPGRSLGIKVITKSKISENVSNVVHTHTKELVLHTISVVQSHYLCTVLLWMNGFRKMFENHWFRDALMWICNDLCIFLSFCAHGVASSSRFRRAFAFSFGRGGFIWPSQISSASPLSSFSWMSLLLIVQHWTTIVAVVTSNKVFEMAKRFCILD